MQQQQKREQQKAPSLLLPSSASASSSLSAEDFVVNNDRLYSNFIYSIKTQITRKTYLNFLKYYMDFLGAKNLRELLVVVDTGENKSQKIIESDIKAYLVYLRTKK
ncbi:MAG TPA: hypothetical protein VF242_00450, partial [Nitrososphaeraceae archaeon]